MRSPLITVLITTHNRPTFVVEAVESVLAQTYSPIEVIVVDDGSGPATAAALAPYMSRIRYLYQSQSGPAAARNRGLRGARGEFIALLDDDDKWMPQKLRRQVDYFNRYPEVGLVHTETLLWNYRTDVFEQKEGSIRDKYVGWCFDLLFLYGNSIMPSTVLLRRQCIDRGTIMTSFYGFRSIFKSVLSASLLSIIACTTRISAKMRWREQNVISASLIGLYGRIVHSGKVWASGRSATDFIICVCLPATCIWTMRISVQPAAILDVLQSITLVIFVFGAYVWPLCYRDRLYSR